MNKSSKLCTKFDLYNNKIDDFQSEVNQINKQEYFE